MNFNFKGFFRQFFFVNYLMPRTIVKSVVALKLISEVVGGKKHFLEKYVISTYLSILNLSNFVIRRFTSIIKKTQFVVMIR